MSELQLKETELVERVRLLEAQNAELGLKIVQAAEKYEPSVIAKHAIKLAQVFNKYYANTKILVDDQEKEARLALVYAVTVLLKEDLRLLGLHAPEKM